MPLTGPPQSSSGPKNTGAAGLLARQLKQMQSARDVSGISCGLVDEVDVFEWEVMLMISDDCRYYGGMCSLQPQPFQEYFPRF